jgi:methanogenic corrinoid protein MtbC1
MDRVTEAALLDHPELGACVYSGQEAREAQEAQDAQAANNASALAPSPQERLARIVRTIEDDIIPRLIRAHRPAVAEPVAVAPVRPTADDVAAFARLMLAPEDLGWQATLDRLRAQGVPVDDIYLGLLAPAAAEVGRMWEEDLCDFTDVTVALGRMQRIMRTLSASYGCDIGPLADGRRVLLLPAPGEQHTFGLSIVAEFFRRSGWEVVGDADSRAADPASLVRGEWFDVIGISVGLDTRLDWLRAGISAIRNASCNRAIAVMVGGPLFVKQPELAEAVGADATAVDGRQAPIVADSMLQLRSQRL